MRQPQAARSHFKRFLGISLGGGRGKNTAIARLEPGKTANSVVLAEARAKRGHRGGGALGIQTAKDVIPFRDDVLLDYLHEWVDDETVVAIDAPLTFPPCLRCQLDCPGMDACTVRSVAWMRAHGSHWR